MSSLNRRTGSVPAKSGSFFEAGLRVRSGDLVELRDQRTNLGIPIEGVPCPRRGEVAPLREIPRRLPQPIDWAVLSTKGGSA